MITTIIINKYKPKVILIGYDNYFGLNRKGSYDYLISNCKYKNIKIIQIDEFKLLNINIKSSMIKNCLVNRNIENVNKFLGRNYSIVGTVKEGKKIGSKLGYPTANVQLVNKEQIIPGNGVYSVNLMLDRYKFKSICNIGIRPTFNENNDLVTIEVHLINKTITLYDKIVTIEFIKYIRNEKKFEDVNKLKEQIKKDIKSLI